MRHARSFATRFRLLALGVLLFGQHAQADLDEDISVLLSGDAAQIVVAGERLWSTPVLRQIYAAPANAPHWTPAHLNVLREEIARVAEDGLLTDDYLARPLASDLAPAARELLATEALARLAFNLRYGKANPQALDPNWNFSRQFGAVDPVAWLRAAISDDALDTTLRDLRPHEPDYDEMRATLAEYRALAANGGWSALPSGDTLKPGTSDPRVPLLRARLAASGDLKSLEADATGTEYDDALLEAVLGFQRRHGLTVDGAVGRGTLQALNVPIAERIAQLRINLERTRWIFRDLEEEFVAVNIAAFEAMYVDHGETRWRGRAIVGRPFRQTPLFKGLLSYLELNPTWTVPPTILREDILPKLRRHPGYLKEKKLRVIDPNGGPVSAAGIDWRTVNANRFPYFLRQDPGPDNALGQIKFMFPNAHAVYLHDTPTRALFAQTERSFSSGCIRIENPLALAELLLRDPTRWNQAGLAGVLATGKTQRIDLPRKVTVMLLYLTAFPGEDGRIQFRRDLYGRDAPVLAALDGPLSWAPPADFKPR